MDRQCPSCGGFCKKSGCERENVKPKEWVGLTDEEIFEHEWWDEETAFAVNKELKEKNT